MSHMYNTCTKSFWFLALLVSWQGSNLRSRGAQYTFEIYSVELKTLFLIS